MYFFAINLQIIKKTTNLKPAPQGSLQEITSTDKLSMERKASKIFCSKQTKPPSPSLLQSGIHWAAEPSSSLPGADGRAPEPGG